MAVVYSQPHFSVHSLLKNTTRTHSFVHATPQPSPNKEFLNAELPYHLEPPDNETQFHILCNALSLFALGQTPPPIPATWPSAVRLSNSHVHDMLFVSINAKIRKASRDESTHLGVSIFGMRLNLCLAKTDAEFQADTAIRSFHLTYQEDKDWRCLQKMKLFKLGKARLVRSKGEFCEWLEARVSERNWLLIVHAGQNKFRYLRNIGNFNPPDAVIGTKAMHELRGVIKDGTRCGPSEATMVETFDDVVKNEVYVAGNEAYRTLKAGLRIVIRDTLPFAGFDSQSVAAAKTFKALQKIVENPSRIGSVTGQKIEETGCQTVDAIAKTTMITKKITKLPVQRDSQFHIRSPTKSTKVPLKFRFASRTVTSKKSNEPKKVIPAPHNAPDCGGLLSLSLVAPQPPLWPELLGEFHYSKFYAVSKTSQKSHDLKELLPSSLVVSREPLWSEIFDHDSSVRDTTGENHSDMDSDLCPSLDYEMHSSGSENGTQLEHDSATYRSYIHTHTEDSFKKTVWKDDFQDTEYSAIEPSLYLEMSRLALYLERLDLGKTD